MSSALWCVTNGRANRREHAASHLEDPARLRIDDEIEVALAVPDLDVLQPVPLLGQRDEALGQELERGGPDRQLVRARSEQVPPHTDEIAEVEQLENRKIALAEGVLADVG